MLVCLFIYLSVVFVLFHVKDIVQVWIKKEEKHTALYINRRLDEVPDQGQ